MGGTQALFNSGLGFKFGITIGWVAEALEPGFAMLSKLAICWRINMFLKISPYRLNAKGLMNWGALFISMGVMAQELFKIPEVSFMGEKEFKHDCIYASLALFGKSCNILAK